MKAVRRVLFVLVMIFIITTSVGCNCLIKGHQYEKVELVQPTCEQSGYTLYKCINCGDSYKGDEKPQLSHKYNKSISNNNGTHMNICTYNENHTSLENCTFSDWIIIVEPTCVSEGKQKRTCIYCNYTEETNIPLLFEHVFSEEITIDIQPTCEEDGLASRHCLVENCNEITDVTVIDSLGHNYDEVVYTWNEDYTKLTATRVCLRDENHIESETVDVNYEVIQKPSCTTNGIGKYTSNYFENSAFSVQELEIEIKNTGHNFDNASYNWSSDYSLLTAKRVCLNDSSHIEEESVETKYSVIQDATCLTKGIGQYVSNSFNNAAFSIQTHTVELKEKGHSYGDVAYTWSKDHSELYAQRICSNDVNHVEEETVNTEYTIIKEATCLSDGEGKYTSNNFLNPAFTSQIYIDIIPAKGHLLEDDYILITEPTFVSKGKIQGVCKRDINHIDYVELPCLNDVDYEVLVNDIDNNREYIYKFNNQQFKFITNLYKVELLVNNNSYGYVSDSLTAYENEIVSITATAKDEYIFFGWFYNDILVSKNSEYQFIMPREDYILEARFIKENYEVVDAWDGSLATELKYGEGTITNPYLISTGSELAFIAYQINNGLGDLNYKYFKLINDIDLNNIEWNPISNKLNGFAGVFDGNGHVIYNLNIQESDSKYIGLFGKINGTIKSLGIESVNINNNDSMYVGGLVGNNSGTIENCYVSGTINIIPNNTAYVGGIAGSNNNTITCCYTTGSITVNSIGSMVGGIVGSNSNIVTNCYSLCDITTSNSNDVGGVIGYNGGGSSTNNYCYEKQNISTFGLTDNIVTEAELLDKSFYFNKLLFKDDVWFINNGLPKLIRKYYQTNINISEFGEASTDNEIIREGFAINLVAKPNIGYEFKGWFINDELLSKEPEFSYIPTCSSDIIPLFEIINYEVNIEISEGLTISGEKEFYNYNDKIVLDVIVDTGYYFEGWFVNGELIHKDDQLEIKITNNINIYVFATPNIYKIDYYESVISTIYFETNGGSFVDDISSNEDKYPIPIKEGHLFTGWYIDESLTVLFDFSGELNESITLYAGWKSNSYNTIEYGDVVQLDNIFCTNKNNREKTIYAFVPLVNQNIIIESKSNVDTFCYLYDKNMSVLAKDDNGTGTSQFRITYTVEAGEIYYIAPCGYYSDVYLTLIIKGNEIPNNNVIFNYIEKEDIKFNTNYRLTYNKKTGYDFIGYFTEENGQGIKITDNLGYSLNKYTYLNDITVYPYYQNSNYVISLDYNDEITEKETKTISYLEEYHLPIPTRDRFIFKGWYFNDILVEDGIWNEYLFDLELIAKWEAININDIIVEEDSFDYEVGKLEIKEKVYPNNAYYERLEYVIIRDDNLTNAYIENNILYASNEGEILVRLMAYDKGNNVIFEKDIIFFCYSTHIVSLEISNDNNIINLNETKEITFNFYPETAYPRGNVVYQIRENTCGATVNGNIISVTQSGKVTLRAKVDDSEWSSYYTFYVPKTIYTPEEFNDIRNELDGYFILGNNIDLSSFSSWNPIGYAEQSSYGLTYINAFKGNLNGDGYTISGLKINAEEVDLLTVGLFGALDNSAVISNLNIVGYEINGLVNSKTIYLAPLSGVCNGKVSNVEVKGQINVIGGEYIGGAIGQLFGEFTDSKVETIINISGTISSSIKVGGGVGYHSNGKYQNCTIVSSISIEDSYGYYVGGAAGMADANIENVEVLDSNITAYGDKGSSYAGLFVGKTSYNSINNINIKGDLNVYSNGTLYVGGIAGQARSIVNSSYSGCVNVLNSNVVYYGNISGYIDGEFYNINNDSKVININAKKDVYAGGLVGYSKNNTMLYGLSLSNNSVNILCNGDIYYGGLVGYSCASLDNNNEAININEINIETSDVAYVGGIFGYASSSEVSNVNVNVDNTDISAYELYYGGLIGKGENTLINNSQYKSAFAEIKVIYNIYYGGIVGYGVNVDNSSAFVSAKIISDSGKMYVGGIAGQLSGNVKDCYSFGTINAEYNKASSYNNYFSYIGGVCGFSCGDIDKTISNVTIDLSFTYKISLYVGGISGKSEGKVSNCKAEGDITSNSRFLSYIGGLVGYSNDVERSFAVNNINSKVFGDTDLYVGGIAGYQDGIISECYYSFADISAFCNNNVYLGGIAGYSNNVINNSYSTYSLIKTDISENGKSAYIGGLVGFNSLGAIISSYSINYVNANASGIDKMLYIGGIAGYNKAVIENCYVLSATDEYIREAIVTNDIETNAIDSASVYAGGIVGCNTGTISNTYSKNIILTRNSYTGGFAGQNSGTITNCISLSTVLVVYGEKVGAFIGESKEGSIYSNCYYLQKSLNEYSQAVGTGNSVGIVSASESQLRGTIIYSDFDRNIWNIVNGKYPDLRRDENIWVKNDYGYYMLINVMNVEDQHQYPMPNSYIKIEFNLGNGEVLEPLYVHADEKVLLTIIPNRIGYIFKGWYFDIEYTNAASGQILSLDHDTVLYAKWEPIIYNLQIEIDGNGVVNTVNQEFIYKQNITLDCITEDYVNYFAGWYINDQLISLDKNYIFSCPANDTLIVAKFLSYYDLIVYANCDDFGTVYHEVDNNKVVETKEVCVSASPNDGYQFFGWFINDELVSTELEYIFVMSSNNINLEARFSKEKYKQISIWDGTSSDKIEKGTGTASDPYIISSARELAYISKESNDSNSNSNIMYNTYFELATDIDLNNIDWVPINTIGNKYIIFDGNGYIIYNLKMSNAPGKNKNFFGLFDNLGEGSKISNLGIENVDINIVNDTYSYTGGIAGTSNADISNCYVTGKIIVENANAENYVGGITGISYGNIDNCYTTGVVKAICNTNSYTYVGGIAGTLKNDYNIKNCYSTCDVISITTAYGSMAGGIVGGFSGKIENCLSTGNIESKSMSESYISDIGYPYSGSSYKNNFHYEKQVLTSNDNNVVNTLGISITDNEIYNKDFYVKNLVFSEDIWNINDGLPSLKIFSDEKENKKYIGSIYYQVFIEESLNGNCNYNNDVIFRVDDYVKLIAYPNEGYIFTGWYNGKELLSADNEFVYSGPSSITITPRFELEDYNVSVDVNYDYLEVGGIGEYNFCDEVVLEAHNYDGYTFIGWYNGEELLSNKSIYEFIMPSHSINLTCLYYKNYHLNINTNCDDFGSAFGETFPYVGKLVTVTAEANDGYDFIGWFEGDKLVSERLEYTFTMPANDYNIEARFTDNKYKQRDIWNGTIATGIERGSGTENDPYLISTASELAFLAYQINNVNKNIYYDKYYKLIRDLDLNNIEWNPIGCGWTSSNTGTKYVNFSGNFDGDNHVIYNLKVTNPQKDYYRYFGLFGDVYQGTVKNIGVEKVNINVQGRTDLSYGGAVVAYSNNSNISSCYSTGYIKVESEHYSYVGGICGYSQGNITECYSSAEMFGVSINSQVCGGGIVGDHGYGSIKNCYATGDVKVVGNQRAYAGGVIGSNSTNSTISYCYSTGNVYAESKINDAEAGGVIGFLYTSLSNCFATGNVTAIAEEGSSYAGGISGYLQGNISNSYKLDKQVLTSKSYDSRGTKITDDELNTKDFYISKLGLNSNIWNIKAGLPTLKFFDMINEEIYYDLFVESIGDVDYKYASVRKGTQIILNARSKEGYNFIGWFDNEKLLSSRREFIYTPTSSHTLYAIYDNLENNTLFVNSDEGIITNNGIYRHYEGESVTLKADVKDGYTFSGWYLDNNNELELLSTDLSYTFEMLASDCKIIALSKTIDYTIVIEENYENGGELMLVEESSNDNYQIDGNTIKNVNPNEIIEILYKINPGYEFIGWFNGSELLSNKIFFRYDSCNEDMTIIAKTKPIEYQLTVSSGNGGTVNSTGGIYTILDEIILTAIPNKTYDFIGWYINGEIYSYDKKLIYIMPYENTNIEAKFEVGYVEVNVASGFNGSASGSTKVLKDSIVTVTASPNPGYVFDGWYLNEVKVSSELIYEHEYNVAGSYNLHARFKESGDYVTYYPLNGEDEWKEIYTGSSYVAPFVIREGYIFDGWYYDKDVWQKPFGYDVEGSIEVYAKWSIQTEVCEYVENAEEDYKLTVYSRLDLNGSNIYDHISIYNTEGNLVIINVDKGDKKGYYYISSNWDTNITYTIVINSNEVFSLDNVNNITVSFEKEEVIDINYQSNVVIIDSNNILEKNNSFVIVQGVNKINEGDIIFYPEDIEGFIHYVYSVEQLADNNQKVYLSDKEILFEDVIDEININQDDINIDLTNSEVTDKETEVVMMAFADMVYEVASVNTLYSQLRMLSENSKIYSFEEPIVEPSFKLDLNKVVFKVSIIINGKISDSAGKTISEFAIRIVLTFENRIGTNVDINMKGLNINSFNFTLTNTTSVSFDIDLVYGNKVNTENFDALKILLDGYKETIAEKKELPFDVESKYENIFNAYKIPITIALGYGVMLDFEFTPFMRYQVIGQLDINTTFSLTNSITLSYSKGDFKVLFNSRLDKNIEIYALAYVNMELGVKVDVYLYLEGLKELLNIYGNFEVGPYVAASGALIYENSNVEYNGYIEWGYFYDYKFGAKIINKDFNLDPSKVVKKIGYIGSYHLILGFTNNDSEFTVDRYVIDLYDEIDHELSVFDLNDYNQKEIVDEKDNYSYELEENDYLYVNDFGMLILKIKPNSPQEIDLYIKAGHSTVKKIVIVINVKDRLIRHENNSNGTIGVDKVTATTGEIVRAQFSSSKKNVIVSSWLVNGVEVGKYSNTVAFAMPESEVILSVLTEEITDAIYIYNINDLEKMRTNMDATFIQMADLDFGNRSFEPIGDDKEAFTGRYFGNGYVIKNISLVNKRYNNSYSTVGFFEQTNGAFICGLSIENVSLYNNLPSTIPSREMEKYMGAVVGVSQDSEFINCEVNDVVFNYYIADNSTFAIQGMNIKTAYGALCGSAVGNNIIYSCNVRNVYLESNVSAKRGLERVGREFACVGGLVGLSSGNIDIYGCYVEGEMKTSVRGISGSCSYVGGLVGNVEGLGNLNARNCIINITGSTNEEATNDEVAVVTTNYNYYTSSTNIYYSYRLNGVNHSNNNANIVGEKYLYSDDCLYLTCVFDAYKWSYNNGELDLKLENVFSIN